MTCLPPRFPQPRSGASAGPRPTRPRLATALALAGLLASGAGSAAANERPPSGMRMAAPASAGAPAAESAGSTPTAAAEPAAARRSAAAASPAPRGLPATGCPLIRPPALNRAEVRSVVLMRIATAMQRPPSQIDVGRSFADQDDGPDAQARFGFAALAIGESLGFDATARFAEEAQRRGLPSAGQGLTIRQLEALSLNAYQEGADGPPPLADPRAVYRLEAVQVRPPEAAAAAVGPLAAAPTGRADGALRPARAAASGAVPSAAAPVARGWKLTRCGHDQVAFWREDEPAGASTTAVVRLTGLPPWNGSEAFVEYLRQVLKRTVPEGYEVQSLKLDPARDPSRRCADASLAAREGEVPYRMRGRFCYAGPDKPYGPAVIFSQVGGGGGGAFEREAARFIERNL